ncbi:MAG TPA: DUF397 domain-containing protein [Streptosporangiaceae bacterium]|jgi:hypothetical protein|nr:DUF397 domain-containing protein [Streptosporangiaceae bacterium]
MNSVGGNWRKSTYSRTGGTECVEVAELSRGLAVRDSTDPDGPRLAFGDIDWDRFLARVRKAAA